jgi:RNA polymerase-binding protein DksA
MSTSIDLDAARSGLLEERKRLVNQLAEHGATEGGDLRSDVDFGDGFADAGAATAERTELLGIVDSLKKSLDEVDSALVKVDEGTYGICENCGKEIGAARMEARPTSTLCLECKSKR